MRSAVSSPWPDLGVWYSKRDGCRSGVSVHLHHIQLTAGNNLTDKLILHMHA